MDALPPTEARHTRSAGLDRLQIAELVDLLIGDQREAVNAVAAQSAVLARVAGEIARRLQRGARLHYVGAGTSGRLGVLDASEMPPTFGTPPELVCAHIAGGDAALRRAVEGAEDDAAAGRAQMRDHVAADDAVVGISASGGAAFVIAAIEEARAQGAYTAVVTSVAVSALARAADDAIVTPTGAEVLAGSTRLKAGTAQKVALNVISTAVMVQLGKVYDNVMIDVVASNEKLRARALRIVRELTGADDERAQAALARSGGRAKLAVAMLRSGLDAAEAQALLDAHGGRLGDALDR